MSELDAIRGYALAAIRHVGEVYTPSRWPWTYGADFLRAHADLVPEHLRRALVVVDSRADASHAMEMWATEIGEPVEALARIFADAYLIEHGIPLSAADRERAGVVEGGGGG